MNEQIFRVCFFYLLQAFEPSWPMNIKYVVTPSLMLVTWFSTSKHARRSGKWKRERSVFQTAQKCAGIPFLISNDELIFITEVECSYSILIRRL